MGCLKLHIVKNYNNLICKLQLETAKHSFSGATQKEHQNKTNVEKLVASIAISIKAIPAGEKEAEK